MQFSLSPRLIILGATLCVFVAFLALVKNPTPSPAESKNSVNCTTNLGQRTVRGDSLSPFINSGQTIQILYGYYKCHSVQREDIIVYAYAGDKTPIIKIVKGLEGDRFALKKTKATRGELVESNCWNLLINGLIVKNSENKSYCFDEQRHKMLALYESDYHALIPQHTYLILGNLIQGTMDSTRFGLVGVSGFVGKAMSLPTPATRN